MAILTWRRELTVIIFLDHENEKTASDRHAQMIKTMLMKHTARMVMFFGDEGYASNTENDHDHVRSNGNINNDNDKDHSGGASQAKNGNHGDAHGNGRR